MLINLQMRPCLIVQCGQNEEYKLVKHEGEFSFFGWKMLCACLKRLRIEKDNRLNHFTIKLGFLC